MPPWPAALAPIATLVGLLPFAPAAQRPEPAALSLFEAKEQHDRSLDGAYETMMATLAQRMAEIDASLKAGRDAGGKSKGELEYERKFLENERMALAGQGRWPTHVAGADALARAAESARAKVGEAYAAAVRKALLETDTKRRDRLDAGRRRFTARNELGPRLTDAAALGLVVTGGGEADWRAGDQGLVPPAAARPDGSWAPFTLQSLPPVPFIVKVAVRRGPADGDYVVRFEDALDMAGELRIPKAAIDALSPKQGVGLEREMHVRIVAMRELVSVELEGEDLDTLATKEAGFGLNLAQLARLSIARADRRGAARVGSLGVKILPVPDAAAHGSATGPEGDSPADEPCGGSLSVSREWGGQMRFVREAWQRYDESVARLSLELLEAFEKVRRPYLESLINPTEETLLKGNQRIEGERARYLSCAELPSLLTQIVPLDLVAKKNEFVAARRELFAAYAKTEELVAPQARRSELARLAAEREEVEAYQDLAPWYDTEILKGMVHSGRDLQEWVWAGNRWIGPRRSGPSGELAPFVVAGELPFEFIVEWTVDCPGLTAAEQFVCRVSRGGDAREARVLGEQVLALSGGDPGEPVRRFALRAVVQRDRISVLVDGVRVFCERGEGSAFAGAGTPVTTSTELALARLGAASQSWIDALRLKPIQTTGRRPAPRDAPRTAPAEPPATRVEPAPRASPPEPEPQPPVAPPAEAAAPAPRKPAGERSMAWAEVLERDPDPRLVTSDSRRGEMRLLSLPWRVRDRASGIEMLLVTPGSYMRGASDGDGEAHPDERPPHYVTISEPFYLGRYEVQASEWAHVMNGAPLAGETLGLPWAGSPEAVSTFLERAGGLRLPTEAEWEFACRAGSGDPRYADLADCAWSPGNANGRKHEVGGRAPNALGFCDMLGNVSECCSDFFDPNAYTACARGVVDPRGPRTGTQRVLRGGSASAKLTDACCRASARSVGEGEEGPIPFRGFRVARTP